jgi:hypothetical protein
MPVRGNLNMDNIGLNIVAKQSNREVYLIQYKYKSDIGFIADLGNGVRCNDENIKELRKKGFWFDIRCSENAAKRILEKVAKLDADNKY